MKNLVLKTPATATETVTPEVVETGKALALPDDPITEGWAQARRFIKTAALFQRASLAAQIMAGFVLLELHKAYQGAGRRNDLSHDVKGWGDAVKAQLDISYQTAYRFMDMARAAKPRLTKGDINLGAILEKNPGALTQAEQELLKTAVHKISDGRTQMEFMLECGVTKQPNTYHGGGGAHEKADGTGEDCTVPATPAQELCYELCAAVTAVRDDACDRSNWPQMSRRQHDTIRAAFEGAAERVIALHIQTYGRNAKG